MILVIAEGKISLDIDETGNEVKRKVYGKVLNEG